LALKSRTEWEKYKTGELKVKGIKPDDIPAAPQRAYANRGWISWGDWLGTGRIASFKKQFDHFLKARAFVRGLRLQNQKEWFAYRAGMLKGKGKKPDHIPSNPNMTYIDKGWTNWADWLGKSKK
jgi:hypothetical protein